MKTAGIICLLAAALLIIPAAAMRGRGRDYAQKEKRVFPAFLYPMAYWVCSIWEQHRGSGGLREREMAQAVYIREDPQEKLDVRLAERVLWVWTGLVAALLAAGILLLLPETDQPIETGTLNRPSFGESDQVSLVVNGLSDEPETIRVTVSGQQPEEKKMQAVFDEAFEGLPKQILGENTSLEEVRGDLDFPQVTDYGIRVSWESLDPEYISHSGHVFNEDVPEEGEVVTLRVVLSYASLSSVYQILVRVCPPTRDSGFFFATLADEIGRVDKESLQSPLLQLPQEWAGKKLHYMVRGNARPWLLVFLLLAAGVLKAFADRQNLRIEYEERRRELQRDYPALLFQFSTMVSCGMTIRGAWCHAVDSYQEKQKKIPQYRSYLYEEMITVQNQIRSGISEEEAYHEFGLRCGGDSYLRLTGFLIQSMKQGISGLSSALDAELGQALTEQKNRALRLGEQMNTKLLLPMFLMLGVVVAVLMAPALLNLR